MAHPHLFARAELVALGIDRPDRLGGDGIDRLRRGVYAEATGDLGPTARYLQQVLAAEVTLTGHRVFSHESAAVLLGLPVLAPWPQQVHLIAERRSGGRSQLDVVRHCLGLDDVPTVLVGELLATSPARTAFDFALSRPFEDAVVLMDAVLARFPSALAELRTLLAGHEGRRGHARAAAVIAFADGLSGSPGESLSRVRIERLGFERPELQVEVVSDGHRDRADFAWRSIRALGEFDGEQKYRLDRYRRGGTPEDVVIREKNRESRMRRSWPTFGRWDWPDLHARGRLERILLGTGVPRIGPPGGTLPLFAR